MKFSTLLISFLSALVFLSPNAVAQNSGVNDIINDIFNGQVPNQNDRAASAYSHIDNIPVEVRYDTNGKALPENAILILSAYAPPPPNVRRSAPLMIGETRLLLTGLEAPLHLVIAAPESVTRTLDYARIDAKIIDANGNPIFELRNAGEYRGQAPAVLTLNRIGFQGPTTRPFEPQFEPMIEAIHGTVHLDSTTPNFRGANLVVRLIEDVLAGGQSNLIIGETRQSLDQKTGPFIFSLEPGLKPDTNSTPLAFDAWVEDWAGRKTHTLTTPLPYNGTTHNYQLRLNTLATPIPTGTEAETSLEILVRGTATFNAHKGLPAGSVLIAALERTEVVNGTISTEALGQVRVSLDGLSGDVKFDVPAQESRLANNLPTPLLRVRIEDANGKLFFSNPAGKRLQRGMNTVKLTAAPDY